MRDRVKETYGAASKATLLITLHDSYIQAFRWATDRLKDEGIIAFVTNGGFTTGGATDAMRRALASEYDRLYVIDLGGDVRSDPSLSGTTHNVFGIQTAVAITIAVRRAAAKATPAKKAEIIAFRTAYRARKSEKFAALKSLAISSGEWTKQLIDADGNWRLGAIDDDYHSMMKLGSKEAKRKPDSTASVIFKAYTNGCKTNRDAWAFNFSKSELQANMERSISFYNKEIDRIRQYSIKETDLESFVTYSDTELSWSGDLKMSLLRGKYAAINENAVRKASYRPFTQEYLYFDRLFNNSVYLLPKAFGDMQPVSQNPSIGVTSHLQVPFGVLAAKIIPSLDFGG